MTDRKKILMLGGSSQQVPAIKKAEEMGYETVLIDYLPDNPGRLVASKWYQESTTDVEAVYEIARSEGVSGVLAYASDPAALPAAIVAERLGLPTNPAKSVEILGVKHKFRRFLQKNGFRSPRTFTFHPDTGMDIIKEGLSQMKFPLMIKPTDSSGSKGVSRIADFSGMEDAIRHADIYSRNKILIAEEYIERGYPHVIGGDIFVEDGKVVLRGDMDCIRDNSGCCLIPVGKKYPSALSIDQRTALYDELQRLITALSIKIGEFNIEFIIDNEDIPHFLELGPRAGGNMIPVQLSDAYGIDLIEANILAAMGRVVSLEPVEPVYCYMTFVLHSNMDGRFGRVFYSPEISEYVYREVIYKRTGDAVERFDGAGKALGIIFMRFPDSESMDYCHDRINELIRVELI